MKKSLKRGFTLIELLVVVAIIGILASVVLAMLSSANKKGQDSAIKEEMTSLRNQAEIYATNNANSYAAMFTGGNTWASTDPTVSAILVYIDKLSTVHTAGSNASAWAAQVQLKENSTQYACTDSSGAVSYSSTAMNAGATNCP